MTEISITNIEWLQRMHIEPVGGLGAISKTHLLRCTVCNHKWTATPTSKIQNFKKWGRGGCPACSADNQQTGKHDVRKRNLESVLDRGFLIISSWDGSTVAGAAGLPVDVTVRQTACGHEFTSTAKNLLTRSVRCGVCGNQKT